jgi:hypothetical protein
LFNSLSAVIRGTGNMAYPAIVTVIGAVLLVPLSAWFIFGGGPLPALGIAGGAIALLAYYALGSIALAAYLASRHSLLQLRVRGVRLRWALFRDILVVGLTGSISTVASNLTIAISTALVGGFGAAAIAGYGTASRLEYLLVPLVFRREVMFKKVAQLQPYVFGLGIAGISLFMMGAGTLGVPRRHWDITFADALSQIQFSPAAFLMLALNGLSAIMAALGGAMYIVVVVCSVFLGRKIGDNEVVQLGPVSGAASAAAVARYGNEGTLKIPGTVVLVGVFFVSFVLYYFVNWKYLAEVWPLK